MLRYERLPLRRTEVDSSVAELNTYSVATIEYDPDHPSLLIPTDFAGDKTQVSSKPIVIHAYDFTVTSNVLTRPFQFYCSPEELGEASVYDLSNKDFLYCLKKVGLVPGSVTAAFNTDLGDLGQVNVSAQCTTRTLRFRSQGYYSKKHKEWRWTVPPIVLSRKRKQIIGWSHYVQNDQGSTSDRTVYSDLVIKKWNQLV